MWTVELRMLTDDLDLYKRFWTRPDVQSWVWSGPGIDIKELEDVCIENRIWTRLRFTGWYSEPFRTLFSEICTYNEEARRAHPVLVI